MPPSRWSSAARDPGVLGADAKFLIPDGAALSCVALAVGARSSSGRDAPTKVMWPEIP